MQFTILGLLLLAGVHATPRAKGHETAASPAHQGRRETAPTVHTTGSLGRVAQQREEAARHTLEAHHREMAAPRHVKPALRATTTPTVHALASAALPAVAHESASRPRRASLPLRPLVPPHRVKPILRGSAALTLHALAGRTSKARAQIDRAAQMNADRAARMMGAAVRMMEAATVHYPAVAGAPAGGGGGIPAESCGPLSAQPNAAPKNYQDARKTKYLKELKKSVAVTFKPGDVVPFKCKKGYTIDGSKTGSRFFDVECLPHGYYKPSKACIEISAACGALPSFNHSHPTGKKVGKSGKQFEYACDTSYSLDGEKPIPVTLSNTLFSLECNEFSSTWSKFEGKCQPYAFIPATEIIKLYDSLFSVLFQVSCASSLKNEFGKLKGPPAGLDKVCAVGLEGDCASLVTQIKSDFESTMQARIAFEKEKSPEWYEASKGAPNINEGAKGFCMALWGLLVLTPSA